MVCETCCDHYMLGVAHGKRGVTMFVRPWRRGDPPLSVRPAVDLTWSEDLPVALPGEFGVGVRRACWCYLNGYGEGYSGTAQSDDIPLKFQGGPCRCEWVTDVSVAY